MSGYNADRVTKDSSSSTALIYAKRPEFQRVPAISSFNSLLHPASQQQITKYKPT